MKSLCQENSCVWFDRYEILEMLGKGSFGRVYLAKDLHLRRKVALKIMTQVSESFMKEVQVLKDIRKPIFPVIYDAWTSGGTGVIVMEYIKGETLQSYMRRVGALGEKTVSMFGQELAEALELLHGQQEKILYLDLKPENIMIEEDGHLRLIDFGTAVQLAPGERTEGIRVGTYGYASPEQWQGRAVDERADVYALGAVLYDMLSGDQIENGEAHLHPGSRESLRKRNRAVPIGMDRIIQKCLKLQPDGRYPNMTAFLKDWNHYQFVGISRIIGKGMLTIGRCVTLIWLAGILWNWDWQQGDTVKLYSSLILYLSMMLMEYIGWRKGQWWQVKKSIWLREEL